MKEESEHTYGCLGTFGEGGQFYPNRGQWLPLFHFLLPKGSSSCMSCSSQGPIYCPHLTDFQQNHLEFCAGDRWKTLSSFTPPNGDPPHPFCRMTERLASLALSIDLRVYLACSLLMNGFDSEVRTDSIYLTK